MWFWTLFACLPPTGSTLHVAPGQGGEWDDPVQAKAWASFTTIQAAIDAASPGDTIQVASGAYLEKVTLTDQLTLEGAGRGETLLAGTIWIKDGHTAHVARMTIVEQDFYTGAGGRPYGDHCLMFDEAGSGSATELEITACDRAISIIQVDDVVLTDVILTDNTWGLFSEGESSFELSNSLITGNGEVGVAPNEYTEATLVHNVFVGNGYDPREGGTRSGAMDFTESSITAVVANNVVVGNNHGVYSVGGTGSVHTHNLVWGNTTDYAGTASASADDLATDPLFTAAAEDDYSLTAESPCIDAGTSTYTVATDRDGDARPQGVEVDLGLDEVVASSLSLVISEVLANPSSESTGELVEVYNAGSGSAELAGLVLTDGDQTDVLQAFDGGTTTLAAGAWGVIVDADYDGVYGIDSGVTVVTTDDTNLGNGLTTSDPVTLYESDGTTLVASASHPADPGEGVSLELIDLAGGDVRGNWRISQCDDGHSPGGPACFPESGDPAALVITEVMANPDNGTTGEYVELYNPGTEELDLSGLILADSGAQDVLVAFDGGTTRLGPGAHAVIVDAGMSGDHLLPAGVVLVTTGDLALGNGLGTLESLVLYDADGTTPIDTFSQGSNPGRGVSLEIIDPAGGDAASNWVPGDDSCGTGSSPGRLNPASGGSCGGLRINEVLANADDEGTGEFIELINLGSDELDLAGLVLSDGDDTDVLESWDGGDTFVVPGGLAVILDPDYDDDHALGAGTVLVTVSGATLGNSLAVSDEIRLYEADGQHPIDAFLYPENPGNGVSMERLDPSDDGTHWSASTCGAGVSPGSENCVSTGSSGTGESAAEILITEILANPADESTGEFVELFNAGTSDVDLAGFVLWDGDGLDALEAFDGDTVLAPGGYALIVDADLEDDLGWPKGTVFLTTDDHAICSGLATSDPLTLYETDGVSVVDTFSYPWDPGEEVSVERVDPAVGDVETNWAASGCESSAGLANCQ